MIDIQLEELKQNLDLVVLKLSSGEEVFTNIIEEDDDMLLVEYALLIKLQDNEYFYSSLLHNDPGTLIEINKSNIVAISEPNELMSNIFFDIVFKDVLEDPNSIV